MRLIREGSGLVTALSLIALPVAAHHSRAIYDRERVVTIEGVVTKYEWRNPHVHVFVETETDTGDAVVWTFDTGTTTMMRGRGWSSDMLAPGDRVIVEGYPVRAAGSTTADVLSIRKSGVTLVDDDTEAAALEAGESAEFRAESLAGIWYVPGFSVANRFSGSASWPLTARGAEGIETYDDRTMNPQNECMARTAPWLMVITGVQRIEVSDDLISIRTEYDTVERTVHMDVASHDSAAVTYQGHSIGWWEDEVLVIDTTHFTDHRNGNARGVPSGPQKHLVERLKLNPDRTNLIYRFELEDPEYLSAPVTGEVGSVYRPDLGFDPIECDLEVARRFLED